MRLRWPQLYLKKYNEAVKDRCYEYLATSLVPSLKLGTKRGSKGSVGTRNFQPTPGGKRKTRVTVQPQPPDKATEKWDSPGKVQFAPKKKDNYLRKVLISSTLFSLSRPQ